MAEDEEKFDNEEERENFENMFGAYQSRRHAMIEWTMYIQEQVYEGNRFIRIPEKFSGVKNYPVYMALCIPPAEQDVDDKSRRAFIPSEDEEEAFGGMFAHTFNVIMN